MLDFCTAKLNQFKMKTIYNWILTAVVALAGTVVYSQGNTTSSLGGRVTDSNGEPLPGANVVAVHTPSGTTYGATTDFDGYYRISNMRTGGPYSVTISYIGFNDFVKNNVILQLGQGERISAQMAESATALDEVVVTGTTNGVFSSKKTGAETNISQRDIQALPQTSRSIADFVRVTPQAQLTEGNDGFSISLGGQNNRYNAIYIDGAVNNDVFGLAGSGTNGGQTGVSPFSVDAIESFQVQLAPFDVKIAGFAGGAISAVTRSGTNQWQGSTYYFVRNQDLAGKTPVDLVGDDEEREKLDDFTARTYGVRIGGPIIKDKLFFFLNYEKEENETPQPFNFSNYNGSDRATIDNLVNFVQNTYGYSMGSFERNSSTLESDKVTAKLDWNIDNKNKLILSARLVDADNLEARTSNNNSLGFLNGSESFLTKTLSTSLEYNFQGDKTSNSFILGYTRVRDDRDPAGSPFPSVQIQDIQGTTINFGAEQFSTANLLNQDIVTITNNFEIYKGRHTITLGTHNEYSKIKNLFFASNFGFYRFASIDDFINGEAALDYEKGYSLVGGNAVGDDSSGASEFDLWQLGFYVQDEVQISDDFKISAGVRFDLPLWSDGPVNEDFNTRTIPLLEAAGKDLQGARVGRGVSPILHVSPRVGFNWDVTGNKSTQIRGGFGIFTSRLPLVWPGATYNNNGVTGGFSNENNFRDTNGNLIPIFFNPDVNQQPVHIQPGSGGTGGNVDLFASGFKLPQRFRTNIAIDQKLPLWGLIASADFIYNENITDIFYENLNIKGPVGRLNGADGRPFYNRFDLIDPTYAGIYLASNHGKGNSWNTALTIRKPLENGFQGQVSWSYGEARNIFDGTSSQNSSQWRNIQTVNGKNSVLPVTRSDFSQGHRVTSFVSYEIPWNDNLKTNVGLFYEGAQGTPYSFIYAEGRDLLNDDSRDNALMYVPANQGEIVLRDSNGNGSSDDEWEILDNFIEGNDYLRSRRGDYVERNGDRGPWNHIVDLRLAQDFSINFGENKHAFQFTFDIFNFTNFLNKDWGTRKFIPSNVSILRTEVAGPNPEFSLNSSVIENGLDIIDDSGIQSSRWQMQFGLRYLFN